MKNKIVHGYVSKYTDNLLGLYSLAMCRSKSKTMRLILEDFFNDKSKETMLTTIKVYFQSKWNMKKAEQKNAKYDEFIKHTRAYLLKRGINRFDVNNIINNIRP